MTEGTRRNGGFFARLGLRDRVSLAVAAAMVLLLLAGAAWLVHSNSSSSPAAVASFVVPGGATSAMSASPSGSPSAVPSQSPSSSPARSKPPQASRGGTGGTVGGGFPDASNTGVRAGTKLSRVPQDVTAGAGWHWDSGSAAVSVTSTASLTNLDINGPVHNDQQYTLTLSNVRIRCTGEGEWCVTLGPASKVTDTEIGGGANGATFVGANGVVCGDYTKATAMTTLTRVNVHHLVQGFHQNGDCTIQDSYLHDFAMGDTCTPGCAGSHSEAIFTGERANDFVIHSTLGSGNSANLFCQSGGIFGPVGGLTVENSRFIAEDRNTQQPSVGLWVQASCPPATLKNNVFDKTGWEAGPASAPAGSSASGNVYTDATPIKVTVSS